MSEELIEPEVMEWPTFQDFYDLYDKKRGRPNAEKYWKKLIQAEKEACMAAVPAYLNSTPDKKYRKDPERYLRHKCWEDEVIGDQSPKSNEGYVNSSAEALARKLADREG